MTPAEPGTFNPELVAALEAERLTGMPRWDVTTTYTRYASWEQHEIRERRRMKQSAKYAEAEQERRDRLRIVPDQEAAS